MSRHGLILPSIAALGLALALVGCGAEPVVVEERLRPARTQRVVASGSVVERTFSGAFRADVESRLSFRVPGTVEELPVRIGDSVAAGRLIARLDPDDYLLQVQEVAASLDQALAARRNAQAERDRVRELYENDNASLSQWDQARAAADSASARVESLSKRLELARRQLDYTRLSAPAAGAIARVWTEVNENVQAGQTIVTMTSGGRPEVEIPLPGSLIAQVGEGDRVVVTAGARPDEALEGVVTEVGVAAFGTTTFPVTVQLTSGGDWLRPGMAAEVTFRFATDAVESRILIPAVAVGEDRAGRFVFVAEEVEDGIAVVHRTPVTIGFLTSDEQIEIIDGVREGDLIVTAGVRRLEEGLRVRLMDSGGDPS
jgi:RND family efflux transporter MFP subunit